jgi:hypothetical protein
MRWLKRRHLQFLTLTALCSSVAFPVSAATVTVSLPSRKLLVNGQAFTIQGVNYSPVPVGSTLNQNASPCSGPYVWWNDRPTYIADFPLIHKLGANTIRTFNLMNSTATASQVLKALDDAQANGLYVIMGYSPNVFQTFASQQAIIQSEVLTSVANYKNHPAVLMWAIGNEVNLAQPNGGDPNWSTPWNNFLNTLAGQIKALDPNHPISTTEGEIPGVWGFSLANPVLQADDGHMTNLDIWGFNIYRGKTFEGMIQALTTSTMTVKPIFMSEFGKDAWHDAINAEDDALQASYINPQWTEINSNLSATGKGSAVLIGGSVFEWTDEWWKDSGPGTSCYLHTHNVIFTRSDDTVDPNYQNEWFGITGIAPIDPATNPSGTTRILRAAYQALQAFWNPSATAAAAVGPSTFFAATVRNYPNPFRSGGVPTKFVAYVNEAGTIKISIYDASSQFVTSLTPITTTGPGRYEVIWDGRNRQGEVVGAGLYFVRIEGHSAAHNEKQFRRVVAVK